MPIESEHEQALRQTADAEGGIDWAKLWTIVGPMLRLLLDLIDRHIATVASRPANPDEVKRAEAARSATTALAVALEQLQSGGTKKP